MDNIEDLKSELKELAKFLDDGCFGQQKTKKQVNLTIELAIMKMQAMSE